MKNKFLLSATLILSIQVTMLAQSSREAYKKERFTSEGKTLKYRILYPENFDENKKYPVLLFLHGAGERGGDNEKQLTHGSDLFLTESFRNQFPSVVIFPQCPAGNYWSRVEVARNQMPFVFDYQYDLAPTEPMQLVMELMDSIRSLSYSKDDQLYVGGLSMGGMGTFEILYRRPEMFAAAFPICGGGDPGSVSEYADDVRLWVFHGGQDNVVLPSYSTEMVIALMKADADVRYTLYKKANHNSWDSAFSEPGLFPWLYSNQMNN